jgi:hypothetical protein
MLARHYLRRDADCGTTWGYAHSMLVAKHAIFLTRRRAITYCHFTGVMGTVLAALAEVRGTIQLSAR